MGGYVICPKSVRKELKREGGRERERGAAPSMNSVKQPERQTGCVEKNGLMSSSAPAERRNQEAQKHPDSMVMARKGVENFTSAIWVLYGAETHLK